MLAVFLSEEVFMTHTPADVVIRLLLPSDAELLSNSFSQQGWHKPVEQFRAYYRQQVEHQRLLAAARSRRSFSFVGCAMSE